MDKDEGYPNAVAFFLCYYEIDISLMETTMITKCKKHQNILVSIYDIIISVLFWIILSFLTLISIKHTCFVDSYEKTFFLKDTPLMHLLIIAAFVVICSFLSKRSFFQIMNKRFENDIRLFSIIKAIGLGLIFLLSLYFILSSKLSPVSDQLFVQESVTAFSKGDFSALQKGGYLAVYPNQLGLVWISYIFFKIFGYGDYVAFQIMNALFLALFYKALADITSIICPGKRVFELGVILLGILFYPLQIYCTFVYGTIPGLALSTYSVLYALYFEKDVKKKDAILSAFFILFAMLFKPNYLICFIGIFLHSVIWLFRVGKVNSEAASKKSYISREILLPVLLIVAFLLQSKLPPFITQAVTGIEAPKGASSLSWIAMGMQESDLAEGWYNGFNTDTLNAYDFDSDLQGEAAKKEIADRLSNFAANPHYTIEFFTRKLTSEWNDPTYEAYWILRTSGRSEASAAWADSFMSYDSFFMGATLLNIFQSFILAGVLLFAATKLFSDKKEGNSTPLLQGAYILIEIILVGGFFFHLMWEAKSQYTLTYVVLLFPLALIGYYNFIKKASSFTKRSLALFFVKMLIPTAIFALVYSGSIGAHMSSDNDAFCRTMERELGK